jgi:phage tail sheath protein FI
MPEYLAPGVYVEETSFRSKSIEGVSTTTTGFVGPTRAGPTSGEPEIVTSLAEFERVYGGGDQLDFGGTIVHNHVWHAARVFFDNGGQRLYISRIYNTLSSPPSGFNADGRAATTTAETMATGFTLSARTPGAAGNGRTSLQLTLGANVLTNGSSNPALSGVQSGDTLWIRWTPTAGTETTQLVRATRAGTGWSLEPLPSGAAIPMAAASGVFAQARLATLTIEVRNSTDRVTHLFDRENPANLLSRMGATPTSTALRLTVPLVFGASSGARSPDFTALLTTATNAPNAATDIGRTLNPPVAIHLTGGSDGDRPEAADYTGSTNITTNLRNGLVALETLEDISIVAAPGYTALADATQHATIASAVLTHCEAMRYRIGVIDPAPALSIGDVRNFRAGFDSKYGALYYPWVRVMDPITATEITLPPSGFVAGIYARNDVNRGVYKAPANEVINGAIGFETTIDQRQQAVLNPEGVNCLRFFEGRGQRVWGARTMSSDSEWKYVNVRRYFNYLERSIERGTQWAVFEPNGPALWANVRRTIEDFLLNEFQSGALLGNKAEQAFFARCDRSTMTQNDLDNGRLICLIGVAPLKPAEFVIFRIGQWTADSRN